MQVTEESVAIVLKNEDGNVLVVKRASDDSFGGLWGLPAATLRDNETEEATAKRAARDKLGVEIEVMSTIGDMTVESDDQRRHLTEYLVQITNGEVKLATRDPSVSRYSEFKYTADPSILIPAAQHGSICSMIYLKDKGIDWA